MSPRHTTRAFPSPASSPNLTLKASEGVPEITIDDAVNSPGPSPSTLSTSEHVVHQLPAIKNWVPKAESLFTELLDSRSPQIYRRTDGSSKTSAYSQSLHPGNIKGSRSSWPGSPDILDDSQKVSETEKQEYDESKMQLVQFKKSPGLFRKCTSFDLERSKPFPARSSMKSPQMLRKGMSFEQHEGQSDPTTESPKLSRKADRNSGMSGKFLMAAHKEIEEESFEDKLDVPVCSTESSHVPKIAEVTNVLSKIENIDNFPKSFTPQVATQKPVQEMFGYVQGDPDIVFTLDPIPLDEEQTVLSEDSGIQTSPEIGNNRKTDASDSDSGRRPNVPKTVPGGSKTNGKDRKHVTKSHSGPIMGKAGLKPVKKEGFFSSSGSPKTSAVRSALMTSAARLKAIGRKSPVTLLSYRTDSIAVPDGDKKIKKDRPSSEPIPVSSSNRKKEKTSSTPDTVALQQHQVAPKTDKREDHHLVNPDVKTKTGSRKSSITVTVSVPETSKHAAVKPKTSTPKLPARMSVSPQPVTLTVQGMRRSSTPRSTLSLASSPAPSTARAAAASTEMSVKLKQKEKVTVVLKTPKASGKSPIPTRKSDGSEPREKKITLIGKAFGGSRMHTSTPEPRESKKSNETKPRVKEETQSGPRTERRGSHGSVHSESSQKSESKKKIFAKKK